MGSLNTASADVKVAVGCVSAVLGIATLVSLVLLALKPYSRELGPMWLPSIGILFNAFMLSTLGASCFWQMAVCVVVVLFGYCLYGLRHSAGNHEGWMRASLLVPSESLPSQPPDPREELCQKSAIRGLSPIASRRPSAVRPRRRPPAR